MRGFLSWIEGKTEQELMTLNYNTLHTVDKHVPRSRRQRRGEAIQIPRYHYLTPQPAGVC
jgi:hypothetical protein